MSQDFKRVASVSAKIPREQFLTYPSEAALNWPGRIGTKGQQLNMKPGFALAMIALLDVQPDDTVLQVGAGTGYYTCVLSRLAPEGRVFATEIDMDLKHQAERNTQLYALGNVEVIGAVKGQIGYEEEAPYNKIIVCGSVLGRQAYQLACQLDPNQGEMVAPVDIGDEFDIAFEPGGLRLRRARITCFKADAEGVELREGVEELFTPLT